jgi:hypothetical protein
LGIDTTVKTIAKCSYGSSDEITSYIDSQFTAFCSGKQSCDLEIDLNELFKNDPVCLTEISKRQTGKIDYGDPKMIGIAHC